MKSLRKGNGRRDVVRNRRLSLEHLEERQLLAVSVLPQQASILPSISRSAVEIRNVGVPALKLQPGVGGQLLAELNLRTVDGSFDRLTALAMLADYRGGLQSGNVLTEHLWADLDRNSRTGLGGCEAEIAMARPDLVSDTVVLRANRPVWLSGQTLKVQVRGDMNTSFTADTFGVQCAGAKLQNVWGQQIPASRIVINGAAPTMHKLVQQQVKLTLGMMCTSGDIAVPGDVVTLGSEQLTASGGSALVQHNYVMIVGSNASGGDIGIPVENAIESVALKNTATGNTVNGILMAGGTGCAIYDFRNFTVTGSETWMVQADTTEALHTGDRLQMRISGGSGPCNFGGLITATTAYNTVATSMQSGKPAIIAGPGGTLVGNLQIFAIPSLTVSEKSGPTTATAVANQRDLTAVTFEVMANDVKDLLISKIAVRNTGDGSLVNGTGWNVFVDTDGNGERDTRIGNGVTFGSNGLVTISVINGGYVIPKGQIVKFWIQCDAVASFTSPPTFQAELAGMDVWRVDTGASVDWNIFHAAQTRWMFVNQGNVYLTVDTSASVPARQMLGGSLSDTVLRVNARAEYEPVDITRLQVSVMNGTAASIERLEFYVEGATRPFAVATKGDVGSSPTPSGYTTFQATMQSRQLIVDPSKADVKILVRASVKSDVNGGVSGEQDQFFIAANTCTVSARGVFSSNNLLPNDGDTTAKGEVYVGTATAAPNHNIEIPVIHTVVMVKAAGIENANPDANGSSIVVGTHNSFAQKVTTLNDTNSNGGINNWVLDGEIFTVTSSNVAFATDGFGFLNVSNSSLVAKSYTLWTITGTQIPAAAGTSVTGNFYVKFDNLSASSVNVTVAAGGSETWALQTRVTNAKVNAALASSYYVGLTDFSNPNANGFGVALGASHLRWKDLDYALSTTFDWMDTVEDYVSGPAYVS